MKKLALLLAAMTAVSAVASAKEVVAAPVVAVEPVALVCPEPVVPTPVWSPKGNFGMTYTYYGQGEYEYNDGNAGNEGGRLQLAGKIDLTEKYYVDYRTRTYNNFNQKGSSKPDRWTTSGEGSDIRTRFFAKHGELFGKVVGTSRVTYRDRQSEAGRREAEYGMMLNFNQYLKELPKSEWFSFDSLVVTPYYHYRWFSNDSNYENRLGMYIDYGFTLPYSFDLSGTVYLNENFLGTTREENRGYDRQDSFYLEMYLSRAWDMYKDEKNHVTIGFDGGIDGYGKDNYNGAINTGSYSELYIYPNINFKHKLNGSTALTFNVGAEYRNWELNKSYGVGDFSWRPQASIGFNTAF